MPDFGAIAHDGTIRFERSFSAPIETVWSYLGTPALLSTWLADGVVEFHRGGYLELCVNMTGGGQRETTCPNRWGVVTQCRPPNLLAFWWTDAITFSNVIFELTRRNAESLLLLTHGSLPIGRVAACSASWHAHLDMLMAQLEHEPAKPYADTFSRVIDYYQLQLTRLRSPQLSAGFQN